MDIFIGSHFHKYYKKSPLTLIDIGARWGLEENWQSAKRYLKAIGFEPDKQEFNNLIRTSNSQVTAYFNTALYEKKATVDFFIMRDRALSSILKPNREFLDNYPDSARYDILQTTQIEVDTLDNVLNSGANTDADFIKLDSQGSELSILKGASNILDSVITGLQIEVEFAPLYQGQPLFSEIDEFVRKFGFQLFDFRPFFWKTSRGMQYGKPRGQIVSADALYLLDTGKFLAVLDPIKDNFLKKSKVLRFISVCLIYGYLDYALKVFESSGDIFSKEEAAIFKKKIAQEVRIARRIPNFWGKSRISAMVKEAADFIHPSNNSWVYWRKDLGNFG